MTRCLILAEMVLWCWAQVFIDNYRLVSIMPSVSFPFKGFLNFRIIFIVGSLSLEWVG